MFDGSSIAGWKAINESDMTLMPDPDTAVMDPFAAKPSLIIICDIASRRPARPIPAIRVHREEGRGVRQSTGIGDAVYFGPEAEFFVFDSVKYGTGGNYGIYQIDSKEGPGAS